MYRTVAGQTIDLNDHSACVFTKSGVKAEKSGLESGSSKCGSDKLIGPAAEAITRLFPRLSLTWLVAVGAADIDLERPRVRPYDTVARCMRGAGLIGYLTIYVLPHLATLRSASTSGCHKVNDTSCIDYRTTLPTD